jgi:hypothetical protein
MKRLAIIATALLVSAAGAAAETDGNRLLRECTGTNEAENLACTAFIAGARDMFDVMHALTTSSGPRCIPTHATYGQVQDVVVK